MRTWILALLILLAGSSPAIACPNCKEAVAGQDDSSRLADGYSRSIMIMMAMPFGLLGTGAFLIARASRRGWLPEL